MIAETVRIELGEDQYEPHLRDQPLPTPSRPPSGIFLTKSVLELWKFEELCVLVDVGFCEAEFRFLIFTIESSRLSA